MKNLDAVVIEPSVAPMASVIWMHGLGADGHDFAGLLPNLNLPHDHAIRFIFPHAPVRPISLNRGYPMRGWYDIYGLGADSKQDEDGILAMSQTIRALIEQQAEVGIASDKVLLAGFSQGGAMALYTGLSHAQPLAGILALSTYLPVAHQIEAWRHPSNQATPILMVHGSYDGIIPLAFAEHSQQHLCRLGYPLSWRVYPMDHSVCSEEVVDIRQFILEQLL